MRSLVVKRLLRRLPLAAAAAFAVTLLGGAELWGRAVTSATETVLRLCERPKATFLTWHDGNVGIRRSDFPSDADLADTTSLESITFGLVLLLMLIWATPRLGEGSGFGRASAAVAALFASHVLHFALAIETVYATQLGEWSTRTYPQWEREVVGSSRYFFDIALKYAMPFVLWGLLVLAPRLREQAQTESRAPRRKKAARG